MIEFEKLICLKRLCSEVFANSMYCIKEKVVTTGFLVNDHLCGLTIAFLLRATRFGFLTLGRLCFYAIIVADLKHASTDRNLSTHNNALCDALNGILLALDS